MPRFRLGQKVLITGAIATKDRGREATIIGIYSSTHTPPGVTTADKYIVRFEQGDEAQFFEIQLVAIEEPRKDA